MADMMAVQRAGTKRKDVFCRRTKTWKAGAVMKWK